MKARVCYTNEELNRILTRADLQWVIDRAPKKWRPTHPEATWLQPYCQGLTADIGCGAEKVLPNILGLDRLAYGERGHFGCMNGVPSAADISADAGNLYFIPDGTLDSAVSRHCFEHLPDPTETIREWLRILRPGGRLAMITPNDHWQDFFNMDKDHKFKCYPSVITNGLRKLNEKNGPVKGKLIEIGKMTFLNWSFFTLIERI